MASGENLKLKTFNKTISFFTDNVPKPNDNVTITMCLETQSFRSQLLKNTNIYRCDRFVMVLVPAEAKRDIEP